MKRTLTIYFLFLISAGFAQHITRPLQNSGAAVWRGSVYLYGFSEKDSGNELVVYRFDSNLRPIDSLKKSTGKQSAGNFLRCWSDTIHGFLNIYHQKKNEDAVGILRFGGDHRLMSEINGVQTGRLNNAGMLGASPYFYGGKVYTVRAVTNSEGRQFYLDCMELKDPKENFDYRLKWQYAFERKNVSRAFVIGAQRRSVTLFAAVDTGPKKGEWLLTVNALNGELIRGSKITPKGETKEYRFGACHTDTIKQLTYVVGEINNAPKGTCKVWYLSVDSFGTIADRLEFLLPANEPKRGASRTSPEIRLVFEDLWPTPLGVTAEADLYLRQNPAMCFNYCNSVKLDIQLAGEGPQAVKTALRSNRTVEDWLYLQDKSLTNGKLCPDSVEGKSVTHQSLPFPVKVKFREGKPLDHFLLQKVETARGQMSYGYLGAEKGKQKVVPISSVRKSLAPRLQAASDSTYLLVNDLPSGGVEMRKGSW